MMMMLVGGIVLGLLQLYTDLGIVDRASRRRFPEQQREVVHPQNGCRRLLDLLTDRDSRGHTNAQTMNYRCQQRDSKHLELANNGEGANGPIVVCNVRRS